MNFLLALLLTIPAFADDAQPAPKPPDKDCKGCGISITMEQHLKDLAAKDQQLAEAQAELRLYQQGLFQCQAAEIHQQAVQQSKQRPLAPQEKAK